MATGDQQDMAARIRAQLPWNWFPDDAPVLDTVLHGLGAAWAWVYDLLAYVRLQTRIRTATDSNLDLISLDFFGDGLPRRVAETDAAFRRRILINLFRERGTRHAMERALTDLTGRAPVIFEPGRPADTGGWSTWGLAYNAAGGYGSALLPYQCFITAFIEPGQGVSGIAGYSTPYAGYGTPRTAWIGASMVRAQISVADVYATINATRPAGTTCWTRVIVGKSQ